MVFCSRFWFASMETAMRCVAGERRYQASKLAGLEELPVIIKDVDDEEMLALALIENLQRSDHEIVEEAKGYRQLIDASGMTQEALSKAVSKSRSAITNSLRLLDLPEVVQQMIFEGKAYCRSCTCNSCSSL